MTLYPAPKPQPKRKQAPTRPKNRGGSAFPKQRDKAYTRWVRTENPCLLAYRFLRRTVSPRDMASTAAIEWRWVHVCFGPRDPAHVNRTRAQGVPDFGEVVPLCRAAHRWRDSHTRQEWLQATGYSQADMESAAAGFALKFVERGGTPPTEDV